MERKVNKRLEEFSKLILKIVKTVHKELGPGFTESVYQGALAIELRRYKVNYLKEMSFEIFYRNQVAGTGRLDFFINDSKLPNVIIETKSVDKLSDSALLLTIAIDLIIEDGTNILPILKNFFDP